MVGYPSSDTYTIVIDFKMLNKLLESFLAAIEKGFTLVETGLSAAGVDSDDSDDGQNYGDEYGSDQYTKDGLGEQEPVHYLAKLERVSATGTHGAASECWCEHVYDIGLVQSISDIQHSFSNSKESNHLGKRSDDNQSKKTQSLPDHSEPQKR